MIDVPFRRNRGLIVIEARITGPRGFRDVDLAVDTGAAMTLIVPDVLDDIGYNARDGDHSTMIHSAVGAEPGYLLRVARFQALGYTIPDLLLHIHDLPDNTGFDGLLGLDFLDQFNYEVRSIENRIRLERIAA